MQATLKELRSLKQEEKTFGNLASKIGDQLNRLKVEELALQNMVRLQNEEQELMAGRMSGTSRAGWHGTEVDVDEEGQEDEEEEREDGVVPLDLIVRNIHNQDWGEMEEEEEEEEEEEDEGVDYNANQGVREHDDIEQFVEQL